MSTTALDVAALGVHALPSSVTRNPPTCSITAPVGAIMSSTTTVTWTYTSTISRPQKFYRIALWAGPSGPVLLDTGEIYSAATSHALNYTLSPFHTYRLFLGVNDGLDGGKNPIFFSPGWTYSDFTVELGSSSFTDLSTVGTVYEIGINGAGYMLADHPETDHRYHRQTVQLEPQRLATGDTPFSEAIDRYNFLAHSDWSSGEGQLYLDRPFSNPSRFYRSINVNPFEQGQLTVNFDRTLHISNSYADPLATVAGDKVYVQTNTAQLTSRDTPGGSNTPFSTGLAGTISDLTSDGSYWYATDGASIRRNNAAANPGADWSTADVTEIEWISDRIAGIDNVASPAEFVDFSSVGVETVRFTHPGATLRGITGGDGYAWYGVNRGNSGVVQYWQVDSSPTNTGIALTLATAETVDNLFFYLGNVFLSTRNTGSDRMRLYRCIPTAGRLTPQFVASFSTASLRKRMLFAGLDRFVAFAWEHASLDNGGVVMSAQQAAIGVFDLSTGGYCRWLGVGATGGFFSPHIAGLVSWQGEFCVALDAYGFYGTMASPTRATTGTLATSVSDLATNITKTLDSVALTTLPLAGSVEVFYSKDSDATFTSLGSMSGSGATKAEFPVGVSGSSFGFKLVLTASGSATPTVKLLSGKVHPLGLVDQVVTVPVNCADELDGLNGVITPDSGPGRGREIARILESLSGSAIQFQDVDWPDQPSGSYQVVSAELEEFFGGYERNKGKRTQHAVCTLTLRRSLS